MYINEVIRRCNELAPNEYTLQEKYAWCDELSAMLSQEYLKKYNKVTLEPDENGEYLLPEGITYEMVDKVIAQGREIEKYDFRSFGITPLYGVREKLYIPEHCQRQGNITVIYIAQYKPIRVIKISDTLNFTDDGFEMLNCPFIVGDSVNIKIGEAEYKEAPILEITSKDVTDSGITSLITIGGGKLSGGLGKKACEIERIITDETLCPPPYDVMYVEFVLAQMAKGQRHFNVYNQHMNVFNQKLRAYHNWLMDRKTQVKDNKMRNWW